MVVAAALVICTGRTKFVGRFKYFAVDFNSAKSLSEMRARFIRAAPSHTDNSCQVIRGALAQRERKTSEPGITSVEIRVLFVNVSVCVRFLWLTEQEKQNEEQTKQWVVYANVRYGASNKKRLQTRKRLKTRKQLQKHWSLIIKVINTMVNTQSGDDERGANSKV